MGPSLSQCLALRMHLVLIGSCFVVLLWVSLHTCSDEVPEGWSIL